MVMLEYRNKNIFLQKVILQIGLKKFLQLFVDMPWTYVISDLNGEELVGTFYEK